MSRYERDQYFEALYALRGAYTRLGDDDRRSSLLVDDAVLYAEAVMQALAAEDAAADAQADADGIPSESIPTGDPRD
jgi:hypothetical protein